MKKINTTTCGWIFFPPKEAFIGDGDWIWHEYQIKQEIELKGLDIWIGDDGGMFIKYEKDKYPFPGIPCLPILHAIDAFKRTIKLRISNPLWWIFFWEKEITELSRVLLARYYLNPFYYSHSVREIRRVLYLIFEKNKKYLIEGICMILEFDGAYRFRLQAFLGNINKEFAVKYPFLAINRELKYAIVEDERPEVKKLWRRFQKIFKILRFVPKFRKIIKQFFENADLEKIKPDEVDLYWQID